MIRKTGQREYTVFSEDGRKRLGSYPSRERAAERLRQVEAAKSAKRVGGTGEWARRRRPELVPRGAEIAAPPSAQKLAFTCGPAALRSALGALGLSVTEEEVARACLTDENGTGPEQLVRGAATWGIRAVACEGMRVNALAEHLALGRPALLAIQQETSDRPDEGHWVAALGTQREPGPAGDVLVMDPSDGSKYGLPVDLLAARWVVAVPPDGAQVRGVAVLVHERARGVEPAAQ